MFTLTIFIIFGTRKVMKITLLLFFLVLEFFFQYFSAKAGPTLTTNGTSKSRDSATLQFYQNADSTSEISHLSHKSQTAAFHSLYPFIPLSHPPPAPNLPWLPCLAYALGWTVMKTHYGAWAEMRVIHFTYSPGTPDPEWFPVFPIVLLMSLPQFSTFRLQYSNLGC